MRDCRMHWSTVHAVARESVTRAKGRKVSSARQGCCAVALSGAFHAPTHPPTFVVVVVVVVTNRSLVVHSRQRLIAKRGWTAFQTRTSLYYAGNTRCFAFVTKMSEMEDEPECASTTSQVHRTTRYTIAYTMLLEVGGSRREWKRCNPVRHSSVRPHCMCPMVFRYTIE